jgi:tripartite motif-containing protein 71
VLHYLDMFNFSRVRSESRTQPSKLQGTVVLILISISIMFLIDLSSFSSDSMGQDSSMGNIQIWGSKGSNPGQFNNPAGIVLDPEGFVFVVDTGNNRIQKFASNGTFLDEWGTAGAGPGQFNTVIGIDEDDDKQNVYITDIGNNRVQRFTNDGLFVSEWGTAGAGPGQFNNPGRIALDPSGNLFVADFGNNRIQKFDENGVLIDTWGTRGAGPGQFNNPTGMTVQFPQGDVFVADSGNSRIQQFDNDGNFIKEYRIGEGVGDITNIDLDVDSDGIVYFTDRNLGVIKVISP